jgi:hypothetical protein
MIRSAILTLFLLLIIDFLYALPVYKKLVKRGLQVVFSTNYRSRDLNPQRSGDVTRLSPFFFTGRFTKVFV